MKGRWLPTTLGAIAMILVVAAIVLPPTGTPRIIANQASAAGTLRTLQAAQIQFMNASAKPSYACHLLELKPFLTSGNESFALPSFYVDGKRSGYVFSFNSCHVDPKTSIAHYQMTAVPMFPGKSGQRAFCMDEDGTIWFDEKGDAAACLANRKPLD